MNFISQLIFYINIKFFIQNIYKDWLKSKFHDKWANFKIPVFNIGGKIDPKIFLNALFVYYLIRIIKLFAIWFSK